MVKKFHYAGKDPYLFVCCGAADAETVSQDVAWLILQGYRVWFDAGEEFPDALPSEVATAVERASLLIVYVNGNPGDATKRPLDWALSSRVAVAPVYLSQQKLSNYYEIMLGTLKGFDRTDSGDFYRNLLTVIPFEPRPAESAQTEYVPAANGRKAVFAEYANGEPDAAKHPGGQGEPERTPKGLYTPAMIVAAVVLLALVCVFVAPIRDRIEAVVAPRQLYEQYYQRGVAASSDPAAALLDFQKAADGGNAKAQYRLGMIYLNGTGAAKDTEKASALLKQSADQGNADAQEQLASLLETGSGVIRDLSAAFGYYQKAAAQEKTLSEFKCGEFLRLGRGTKPDYAKAMEWYQKAAAGGSADAQNGIGLLYLGGQGVKADAGKAFQAFSLAAKGGSAAGSDNLGQLYAVGKGVAADLSKALACFTASANAGNADGQFDLGHLFYTGIGVTKDYGSAAVWFQKAAAQGSAKAEYYLGYMYEYGRGVTRDLTKAKSLYTAAAAGGYGDAAARLKLSKFR